MKTSSCELKAVLIHADRYCCLIGVTADRFSTRVDNNSTEGMISVGEGLFFMVVCKVVLSSYSLG